MRNEERKKISCRAFRREKNILPTRLLEKKNLLTRNHPPTPPPPLQKLNGRPLSEVNQNGNFFHWNIPHRKYVIDKPLANKGFKWASRLSFSKVRHANNGESDRHCSSHSNAVSLYEVLFIKLTALFNNMRTLTFKPQPTNAFFATINQMFGGSS